MFSATPRALLFALAVSAVNVSATPNLSMKISGPVVADGVEKFLISTTLVNTGNQTLKLLNDPRGALHDMPSNTFTITTDSGDSPTFVGVRVKYVPSLAAKSTNPKAFTVLAPGESAAMLHDLSKAYNFTATGMTNYTVEASNVFHYVHPDTSAVVPIQADTDPEPHVASLFGKLSVTRTTSALIKRSKFQGCSSTQQTQLNAAAPAAQSYVSAAAAYLRTHTATSLRYATWFGTFTSARRATVLSHYTNIGSHNFLSLTYDCTCNDANTYAYVYPNQFGIIYLCGAFWRAPATGTDSRAGTLVHEASHFTVNGGTKDYAYGQTNAKNLAKSNPANAVFNADSHEYFAENTPVQA